VTIMPSESAVISAAIMMCASLVTAWRCSPAPSSAGS
jgi:hypothetical protein